MSLLQSAEGVNTTALTAQVALAAMFFLSSVVSFIYRFLLVWLLTPFAQGCTESSLDGIVTGDAPTFYGLQLVKKDLNLKVSSLGNPGMPMPMAMDKWFPNILQALPGMEGMMTAMMKKKMESKGVASLEDLRELSQEADVKMVACQMTVDLFDMNPGDFIDGIEFGGAATFFEFAGDADITLYI